MLNGEILREEACAISPNNRSFRYGDGFFETLKLLDERVALRDLHFDRLFSSLETLQFEKPATLTPAALEADMLQLVRKNGHEKGARVRIQIFRGNGGLYDPENLRPNVLIQSLPLSPEVNRLNEKGWIMGLYTRARKTADDFSHVKHSNYLCYVMAALWAREQQLNDALLLNAFDRLADATIANLFVVHRGIVKTPALTEGCIGGVMRRYLLQCLRREGIPAEETIIDVNTLNEASELFLTNALYGIRWVQSVDNQHFENKVASLLYRQFVAPLWQ